MGVTVAFLVEVDTRRDEEELPYELSQSSRACQCCRYNDVVVVGSVVLLSESQERVEGPMPAMFSSSQPTEFELNDINCLLQEPAGRWIRL